LIPSSVVICGINWMKSRNHHNRSSSVIISWLQVSTNVKKK
jgi:hypothetical protein